jgi:hypothetical protein
MNAAQVPHQSWLVGGAQQRLQAGRPGLLSAVVERVAALNGAAELVPGMQQFCLLLVPQILGEGAAAHAQADGHHPQHQHQAEVGVATYVPGGTPGVAYQRS